MKKVDWSKLPNEILLNILQRNDNNTNSQCSLTCRDWKYPAQCMLFEKISCLTNGKLDLILKAFSIYQNSCTDFNQSPGNYVKIVDCQFFHYTVEWSLVDKLFPFVEVIQLHYYCIRDYDEIYRLLKEGKFPHLKVLPGNIYSKTPLELLLDRREKIEELKLYPTSLEDEILQNLHQFPNLKRLDLENLQEMHLEHFFSKEIQHLKSINIAFGSQSKNFDTSRLNMDNIQPFPNTRELRIICYGITNYDKCIRYIMKKFPNLETLQLNNSQIHCGKGNRQVFPTMDCIFQFLVYLSKMKKRSRTDMITNKFTIQLVKKFLNYVIDQRTVQYKNKNITLKILFNFVHPHTYLEDHNPPDITESMAIRNRKSGGYKKNECKLIVWYQVRQVNTFQTHLQLLREVGNMNITCLKILAHDWFRLYAGSIIGLCDFSSTIPVVLDEIFSHFSKLEYLEISDVSNFLWNKEECLVEDTLNNTITYMNYTRCTLSKEIFPTIFERCPNLKTLCLANCRNTNNEYEAISRYFPIITPSTCLEELIINLDNTTLFHYKKVFIRLITKNKKPRYCKIINEPGFPIVKFPEQDCTEDHYNMCLDDEECGVFDIHFESVAKLIVQFKTEDYGSNEDYLAEVYDLSDIDYEKEEYAYWTEKKYIEEDL